MILHMDRNDYQGHRRSISAVILMVMRLYLDFHIEDS